MLPNYIYPWPRGATGLLCPVRFETSYSRNGGFNWRPMVKLDPMVQLSTVYLFLPFMGVPTGSVAPVVMKGFFSRSIPTGSTSYNGTLIPIPIPSMSSLVFLHARRELATWKVTKERVGGWSLTSRSTLRGLERRRESATTRARTPDSIHWFVPVLVVSICLHGGLSLLSVECVCGLLLFCLCSTIYFQPLSQQLERSNQLEPTGLVRKWSPKPKSTGSCLSTPPCVYGTVDCSTSCSTVDRHPRLLLPFFMVDARTPDPLLLDLPDSLAQYRIAHGGVVICLFGVQLSFDLPICLPGGGPLLRSLSRFRWVALWIRSGLMLVPAARVAQLTIHNRVPDSTMGVEGLLIPTCSFPYVWGH